MRLSTRLLVAMLLAALLIAIVPPSPARAIGTDVAHTPPTDVTVSATFDGDGDQSPPSPCVNAAAVFDANDSTCWGRGQTGTNAQLYTHAKNGFYLQFAAGASAVSFDLLSFRLLWTVCQYGFSWNHGGCSTNVDYGAAPTILHYYVYCDDGSGDPVSDPLVYDSGSVSLAGGTIAGHDTGQVNLSSACAVNTSTTRRLHVKYTTDGHFGWGDGQAVVVSSFEAYAVGTSIPAEFTDYIAGLHIEHPSFRRTIGWQWIKTWSGVWSVTDSDDDVLAGGLSGASSGTFGFVSIQCIPLCGSDTYTITIHEDGHDEVTYEIDSDDSGYLIAPAGAAIFVYVNGCYNASTNQCHDAAIPVGGSTHWDNAASSAANVRFKYECNNSSQLDPTCEGGTVWIGKAETDDFGCGTQNPLYGPITGTSPNTLYEQVMTGWGTAGSMRGIVVWRSGTDPDVHACRVFGPMATAGGIEVPRETPQAQLPECDIYSLPCQIGIAIRDALDGGRELWETAVDEAVGQLHDAAASKLPFAYVVLAVDGISDQIARANASVENSDDCEGVTLNVPLPYGGSNLSASPSPFPINVLRCDQLEPVMGTSWYQAIRTALDPALWLLFAWSQFKALQPKTSLNG